MTVLAVILSALLNFIALGMALKAYQYKCAGAESMVILAVLVWVFTPLLHVTSPGGWSLFSFVVSILVAAGNLFRAWRVPAE